MKRPKPPQNNKAYEAMLSSTKFNDEGEEVPDGVSLKKLISSEDEYCRAYGQSLLEFKAKVQGESKASFAARLGLII